MAAQLPATRLAEGHWRQDDAREYFDELNPGQ
jgi:hypothetical protein